jgi:hypothetical protein
MSVAKAGFISESVLRIRRGRAGRAMAGHAVIGTALAMAVAFVDTWLF